MLKKFYIILAFLITLLLGVVIGIKLYENKNSRDKSNLVIEKTFNGKEENNIFKEMGPEPTLNGENSEEEHLKDDEQTVAKESEVKEIINETLLSKGGKLAILIDDCGSGISLAEDFKNLKMPLSFAILPYLSKSREVNQFLRDNGYKTLLHLPMEGSDKVVNDKTELLLRSNLSKEEIHSIFERVLENVGPVSGFNNHMGSVFTSSKEGMEIVLEFAKNKNLFFIDSKTTAQSMGRKVAKNLNIPSAECIHFLDNSKEVADIEKELVKAIQIAQKRGRAVVIGHFHKNMVEALKNSKTTLEKSNIKLVFVDEILE